MNGPEDGFRDYVGGRIAELQRENQLERLLEEIEQELARDVERVTDDNETLAAVEAWAGLASHVVASFYAPASPWPRRVAGWGKRVIARLQSVAQRLVPALRQAAGALGAQGFSIGVAFPWGLSISINW